MRWRSIVPAAALAVAAPLAAQTPPTTEPWYEKVKIGGLLFGDAYWVAADHDPEIKDQTGFWLRRAFLTFDFAVAESWSVRFRLEANSPGDFVTDERIEPFVKDAYVAWKKENNELFFGISPSPTFNLVEAFWGYRAVEKTPIDLYRLGSSRDFGVSYRGRTAGGKLIVHAMGGNGAGEASETNQGKKAMLSLALQPTKAVVVELYADYDDRPGSTNRSTYHAFVGFKAASSRYGAEFASQHRQVEVGTDLTLAVGSLFGVWDVSKKLSLLARIDRAFDGNPEADQIPYLVLADDTEFDLALLGLDWKIHKAVSLIPNVEYVAYRETNGLPAPDDDLFARLTLYVQF